MWFDRVCFRGVFHPLSLVAMLKSVLSPSLIWFISELNLADGVVSLGKSLAAAFGWDSISPEGNRLIHLNQVSISVFTYLNLLIVDLYRRN